MNVVELRHLLDSLRGEERFAKVFFKTEKDELFPVETARYISNGELKMLILQIIPKDM